MVMWYLSYVQIYTTKYIDREKEIPQCISHFNLLQVIVLQNDWLSVTTISVLFTWHAVIMTKLKLISNWPPSFCYILGHVFREKYKQPNISIILIIPNIWNKTSLKFDHGNKLKLRVNMDTLKTKTAKSNHVLFNFVSILCTSNWCRIYSKVPCTHW